MNWFRQNKFLGVFLVVFIVATLVAGYFLLHEKSAADDQQTRLDQTASELTRLRSTKPFPSAENLQKTKERVNDYRDSLNDLENELKARTLPVVPLEPNEFQAQLRQAVNSVLENAKTSKVKMPDHFYLGFDQYATSLPNSKAAPLLGQELAAIAMLTNGIVNAHVDALESLVRTPLPEENPAAAATPPPSARGKTRGAGRGEQGTNAKGNAAAPIVSAHPVEIAFSANPTAARKVLNQVATSKEQLFILRTLNVKNQVEKGPARDSSLAGNPPPPPPPGNATPAGTPPPPTVKFIVGAEHIDVKARVDILSLSAEKEAR